MAMGIANRTPDSFFDKGSYFAFDAFLRKVEELVADGADIIDVGGVKAGPGEEVPLDEELDRVVPAVEAIHQRFDVLISVDTWSAAVLDASLHAGASIGNDISGFADPDYLRVAATHDAAVVATHIRLQPRVKDPDPQYNDLVGDVHRFLADRYERAVKAGVHPRAIAVDAGFDLGKTATQSLALLRATDRLTDLGAPVFISASNKGFLGEALGLPLGERRVASLHAVSISYILGARIFRVHDVKGTRRTLDTLAALSDPSTFVDQTADLRSGS
jgi:dihydropteroate synthase